MMREDELSHPCASCDCGRDLGGSVTERRGAIGFIVHERCTANEDLGISGELQDHVVVHVERVRDVRERRVAAAYSGSERAPTLVDDVASQHLACAELTLARPAC